MPRFRISVRNVLFVALCLVAAACGKSSPKISLSTEKIVVRGHVGVHGVGFTPKANIQSHLRRPDGSEFPELPMLTDSRGEISHDIDTMLFLPGIHEVWMIDSTTGVSSNVVHFEVLLHEPSK